MLRFRPLRNRHRRSARLGPLSVVSLALLLTLGSAWGPAGADDGVATPGSTYEARMLALFRQALTPEQFCELRFLLSLGWQFEQDVNVDVLTVHGGRPLEMQTLAEAQAAGYLRLKLPVGFDLAGARAFGRSVGLLGDSGATRCAYKHKIAVNTRRAAEQLSAMSESGRYAFPELLSIWDSPWFRIRFPKDEWSQRDISYVAQGSSAAAMKAFLDRGATAECYVGQALCCYLQQYYLYGHEWFDEVWQPEDIWVGRPRDIKDTPVGRYTRSEMRYRWRALLLDSKAQRRDPALGLARFGPQAFTGTSGIVINQVPGVASNENFVIVSASPRAVKQIVDGGGLQVFMPPANEAWRVMNATSGIFKSRRGKQWAARRIDEIYSTPIFKEIEVYVHPYGIVDFAYLFKKKMQVADTPTRVVIYTYGREEFCFQRYRAAYKQRCLNEMGYASTVQPASAFDPNPNAMRGPYLSGRTQPGPQTRPQNGARRPAAVPRRPMVGRCPPPPPPPPPLPGSVVPASSR